MLAPEFLGKRLAQIAKETSELVLQFRRESDPSAQAKLLEQIEAAIANYQHVSESLRKSLKEQTK